MLPITMFIQRVLFRRFPQNKMKTQEIFMKTGSTPAEISGNSISQNYFLEDVGELGANLRC